MPTRSVIDSEEELVRAEEIITLLLRKGENLSPEEETLLDLVSDLVEKYEDEHYAIPHASPTDVLRFFIKTER